MCFYGGREIATTMGDREMGERDEIYLSIGAFVGFYLGKRYLCVCVVYPASAYNQSGWGKWVAPLYL